MEDRAYHWNRLFSKNSWKYFTQWRNAMRSLKAFTVSFQLWILLTVLHYEMYHTLQSLSLSLSTTHIQALDIQCTLWSPKYTPNDILDISKNYHLLLRYLYLPYTLHWYFFGHAAIKNTWRFSEIFIQIICFSFLSFPL